MKIPYLKRKGKLVITDQNKYVPEIRQHVSKTTSTRLPNRKQTSDITGTIVRNDGLNTIIHYNYGEPEED